MQDKSRVVESRLDWIVINTNCGGKVVVMLLWYSFRYKQLWVKNKTFIIPFFVTILTQKAHVAMYFTNLGELP